MWMTPPGAMCRRHLLGEHVEIHMFLGSLLRGKNLGGFFDGGLLEPAALKSRHDTLAAEMERRGYRHRSPIDAAEADRALAGLAPVRRTLRVDAAASATELARRCPACAEGLHARPSALPIPEA